MLLIAAVATAQTEKGRWTVGAQVGNVLYNSQYGYRSFSGSIAPSAGYFVADNLAIGAGLPLSYSTSRSTDRSYRSWNTGIGLSPFVRYYFGKATLRPYGAIGYSYSRSWQHTESPNETINYRGFSSSLSPTVGVAYFINRTVAMDAGISYVSNWYNNGFDDSQPSTTSRSNYLALNIGFQLFFGK